MGNKLEIKKQVEIHNRKASHEYVFLEKYRAGIVLKGTEVKSIRMGKANLNDAFCLFIGNELFVRNLHITPYEKSSFQNHDEKADRKLLLTKKELRKLHNKLKDIGLTIIPIRLYINERGFVKLDIVLAKGKKMYDKREDIKKRDIEREMKRLS
ncbi:MAG: SsrA-binding protein SmpB [Cytophagales bacterium]|nr:SsrA-binding protein SmpB [Cytophagales bacterium]MDW8383973.1 SsrA-binding protein SmpB [Flammeovirgaceae bacterium]